jgi:hypothetical protein
VRFARMRYRDFVFLRTCGYSCCELEERRQSPEFSIEIRRGNWGAFCLAPHYRRSDHSLVVAGSQGS